MPKSMNLAPAGNTRGRNKGRKPGTSMNFWVLPQQHPLLPVALCFRRKELRAEMASQQESVSSVPGLPAASSRHYPAGELGALRPVPSPINSTITCDLPGTLGSAPSVLCDLPGTLGSPSSLSPPSPGNLLAGRRQEGSVSV